MPSGARAPLSPLLAYFRGLSTPAQPPPVFPERAVCY